MNAAKIHLSANELALVQNADILLTKNRIIKKVYHLFGALAQDQRALLEQHPDNWPPEALLTAPKIARGENYLGLPYVMLDYPRLFSKTDVFAIRTFFWWGHFFSVTLHLKGAHKHHFEKALKNRLPILAENDFYISTDHDEWRHDWDGDHYMPLQKSDTRPAAQILSAKDFCKLSARISLQRWNEAKEGLVDLYHLLLGVLDPNFPGDGTGL